MLKILEKFNSTSCFNKAEDNETIFVLLGRDESAQVAIDAWIADRIKRGKNTEFDEQIGEAVSCRMQMQFDAIRYKDRMKERNKGVKENGQSR